MMMRRRRKKEEQDEGVGLLPAEQVASTQSHEIHLTGASRANGGEEHLRRNHRVRVYRWV